MEDTLGEQSRICAAVQWTRLNPYCNGRYSWSLARKYNLEAEIRLNPYCNGRYSWSTYNYEDYIYRCFVLILIVMEDTLGALKIAKVTPYQTRS